MAGHLVQYADDDGVLYCRACRPAPIDYRALLVKYIRHVGDCEGSTFVHQVHINDDFTGTELVELERLEQAAVRAAAPDPQYERFAARASDFPPQVEALNQRMPEVTVHAAADAHR